MPQQTVVIVNRKGLHARASAKFVKMVATLPDTISVSVAKDGNSANGGSIMGLMMLGAARDHSIDIIVEGDDILTAEAALTKLTGLVSDGFGED